MRGKAKVKGQKAEGQGPGARGQGLGTAVTAPSGDASQDDSGTPRLLDRWWAALLAAAWVIGIVVIYYWLQFGRLARVLTR